MLLSPRWVNWRNTSASSMQASTVETNHQADTRRFVLILCSTLNTTDTIKHATLQVDTLPTFPMWVSTLG
jgi:hypothetical protein